VDLRIRRDLPNASYSARPSLSIAVTWHPWVTFSRHGIASSPLAVIH
jgi:hypothetical protein